MKFRTVALACLFVMFCNVAMLFGQKSDIVLVGPWILYEEKNFSKSSGAGGKVAALIAISPGIGDNSAGSRDFHYPQLSTNDGYYVFLPGIYCLTFDDECAPVRGSQLNTDGYPPDPDTAHPALLQLKVALTNGAWDWASRYSLQYSHLPVILILPMPDSYSNEDEWYMRFGDKFDSTGNKYKTQTKTGSEDIGVVLHYSKGPTDHYNLFGCSTKPVTADNCKDLEEVPLGHVTNLQNVGTLQIEMKAPMVVDACDQHVRRAYPEMIHLLGKELLSTEMAVVDPAYKTKPDGTPQYDNGTDAAITCLKDDCQNPANNCGPRSSSSTGMSMSMPGMFSVGTLSSLVEDFDRKDPDHKDLLTPDQKKFLLADEIKEAWHDLNPHFPRISQLAYLQQILEVSSTRLQVLIAQLQAEVTASAQMRQDLGTTNRFHNANGSNSEDVLNLLQARIDPVEKTLLATNPTKDAKDCRSAIMHLVPGP